MKKLFMGLSVVLLGFGCDAPTNEVGKEPSGLRRYHSVGVLREVSEDRLKAVISHEEIPNFMPAMTMELSVKHAEEMRNLGPGDRIQFTLVVSEEGHWIEEIHRLEDEGSAKVSAGSGTWGKISPELKPGDTLPDFEFTSEDGKLVRFSDFRGNFLAFTFIFTRCPLPDFCPRMGRNFSEARKLLSQRPMGSQECRFLSISFDPENDTPEVLKTYADIYREGETEGWLFAIASEEVLEKLAPMLDLRFKLENGTISHNLRTVVVDPKGRIVQQFDGNEWLPEQLSEAIWEAARDELE